MRNGMRAISEPKRKPVINEVVVDKLGNRYVVLAVGLRYVDVNDLRPERSKVKHLVKISDLNVTGEMYAD